LLPGKYTNPTNVFVGKGVLLSALTESFTAEDNVLVVCGSNETAKIIIKEEIDIFFKNNNIPYTVLKGVESNPKSDKVYDGIAICKKNSINKIIAIGGGSVIDTAKSIGIGANYIGDFFDYFKGNVKVTESLDVGVILTISGAGSETSDGAVITHGAFKYAVGSPLMYPKFAVLDPQYTITVPDKLLYAGIVDSVTHVLERYFSNTNNVVTSDALCESLIKVLIKLAFKTLNNNQDLEIRMDLMWASKLAHDSTVGFGRKHDWASHTVAHEIAVRYNTIHGETLAVIYPAWMKLVSKKGHTNVLNQLHDKVFSDNEIIQLVGKYSNAIDAYSAFLNKLNMTSSIFKLTNDSEINKNFADIANSCSSTTLSGTIGNYTRLNVQDITELLCLAEYEFVDSNKGITK